MNYQEFRERCDKLELTNYQVSELSGISKATLSQWKNGNSKPSPKTLKRLEYFLENYDPALVNFYVSFPSKAHVATETAQRVAYNKGEYFIESFGVRINGGHPVKMSDAQFAELRRNTEIFADSWLKAHELI